MNARPPVHRRVASLVASLVLLGGHANCASLPFVSPMFADNMVLQRGKTNVIWGWADAGAKVSVAISGQTIAVTAGTDGHWQARFVPPATGGPYTLNVISSQSVSFTNILVGDVWLCGGQSNMELPLSDARNGKEEVAAASHDRIRFFHVRPQPAYAPALIASGSWKVCSPQTAAEGHGISAVGYFFARKIQGETNVPIGLILDYWGGTPAESWTSHRTLRESFSEFSAGLSEVSRLHSRRATPHGNFITHWYEEYDPGEKQNWSASDFDDRHWNSVTIPGGFAELGVPETPALCYFRKTVVLPDPIPAGEARIFLGVIEKMDTTYVNGRRVGAESWVSNHRNYSIPGDVLKPGTNVVTVRVFKTKADGGFRAPPEELKLVLGDKREIPLAGGWKGKLSADARPPQPMPLGFESWPTMPAVLFNGMIAPVSPFAISGAIWYQGESNTGRAAQYRRLLPAMIADWRKSFQQGDFPFYIVSLAAFKQRRDTPGNDDWAELRAAQAFAARTVPNSALALAIDVGDASDIHPKDKKEVGERLALCALANHYGRKITCSGPTFERAEGIPGALKLHFKNTDGGLVVKGEKLGELSIAGDDRKWFWAEARIEGGAVVVSSSQVPRPKFARYAWQTNPLATLYNGAGLPAVPFETEEEPRSTSPQP